MTQKRRRFREVLLKWQAQNTLLVEDLETHEFFQLFLVRKRSQMGGVLCSDLCGFRLKRVHFSCLRCRLRGVVNHKLPSILPVAPYILLIRRDRPKWIVALVKNWLSVAEHLANL